MYLTSINYSVIFWRGQTTGASHFLLSTSCWSVFIILDWFQVAQSCSRKIIERVLDALLTLEPQFLYYPTVAENHATTSRMLKRFKIPNLYLGVDGNHIRWNETPRCIPADHKKEQYRNSKNFHSINMMIIGNDQWIVSRWPGSVHDNLTNTDLRMRTK